MTSWPDPARPKAGDVIIYTITVTNDGPSDAANVRVIHQLADGLEFDPTKSTSGSTVSDQTITYNIGTMKVHDVKTFNIATKAAPQGDASSTTTCHIGPDGRVPRQQLGRGHGRSRWADGHLVRCGRRQPRDAAEYGLAHQAQQSAEK
ncbi:MAG: DUF11 domain-containing protein [Pirellulaceae bacterium]